VFDYYKDKPPFTEGSLTEDYKFSVDLAKHGFQVHYVLEKVPRLLNTGKLKWDYVATRSLFPKLLELRSNRNTLDLWYYHAVFAYQGYSVKGEQTQPCSEMGLI